MEFTGERVIPKRVEQNPLFEEHLARYFFAGELVRGQRVLDLGCGTGYGSYYLSQKGAQFVLATDIDAEAIQYARLHYQAPNLAFVQSNAIHLPVYQQTFDIVVSFEVIEHLQDVTTYLAEINRILTDAGWSIGSTPNRLIYGMGADKSANPFHWKEYDPTELDSTLKEFFSSVLILGQRPFQGYVLGPVPIDQKEAGTVVEFLPENIRTEHTIADTKLLIYLVSKSNDHNNIIQQYLGSHYYLGQPSSYHEMSVNSYVQNLQNGFSRMQKDYHKLETLVRGYESGKFIRFMNMLHRWRSQVFNNKARQESLDNK